MRRERHGRRHRAFVVDGEIRRDVRRKNIARGDITVAGTSSGMPYTAYVSEQMSTRSPTWASVGDAVDSHPRRDVDRLGWRVDRHERGRFCK